MFRLVVCSFLFLILSSAAYACACGKPVGISDRELVNSEKAAADVVFVGRVLKIVKDRNRRGVPTGGYNAVFVASEIWKGKQVKRIRIFFSNLCCLCDRSFSKGKEYLVYASGDTFLTASVCGRTKETANSEIEIDRKYLGASMTAPTKN